MKARWAAMEPRERWLVGVAGVVIAATVLWVGVWEPLDARRDALREQVVAQQALADWLAALDPAQFGTTRGLTGTASSARTLDGRSPLAIIDQTARAAGLAGALARIEPAAPGEVRVVLQRAEFPSLMRWLDELIETRPFRVVDLRADRAEPGRVDATVVLAGTD